jgi:hypothetical protein
LNSKLKIFNIAASWSVCHEELSSSCLSEKMDNSDNQNVGEKGQKCRLVRKGVEKERREDRK